MVSVAHLFHTSHAHTSPAPSGTQIDVWITLGEGDLEEVSDSGVVGDGGGDGGSNPGGTFRK